MAGGIGGWKVRKKQNHVLPYQYFHRCIYCRKKMPTYAAANACRTEDLNRVKEDAEEREHKKKQKKRSKKSLGGTLSSKKKIVSTCTHCHVVYGTMEEAHMCEKSHIEYL